MDVVLSNCTKMMMLMPPLSYLNHINTHIIQSNLSQKPLIMPLSLGMSNQYWVPKIPVPNCTVPVEFWYPFFAFFGIGNSARYRLDTLFYPRFTFEYQHFQYRYQNSIGTIQFGTG
ncbi:hypothetical protein HanRHA438_Chr01g0042101 [Helianthus annuus]|uniref:Uncharacterized protein n=1 Tax=Helianthus annuus TaxID=4232 RepID=A0A9K3JZC2_HELAN|nr:hypothetical protein HanXRQr2_Chr01g0041271 [Helianthus annuus]KAJ0949760.1 hypothetical protein HanRHA438_Chr01g0042101 [Helianthus annuus]